MLVLITYDVDTLSPTGKRRLRNVAKQCTNFGQRVQNSVFECMLDSTQLAELQNRLKKVVDLEKDSIRFYVMGNSWQRKVEHWGVKPSLNPEDTLIV